MVPFRSGPPGMAVQRPWFPMKFPGPWSIDLPGGGPWKIKQHQNQKWHSTHNRLNGRFINKLNQQSTRLNFSSSTWDWIDILVNVRPVEHSYLGSSPPHRWRWVLGLSMLHGHEVVHVHGGWTARVLLTWSEQVIHARVASASWHASHAAATSTHRHWRS